MNRPFWVALHGMAHSFIELDKTVIHVIQLVSFLWLWFSVMAWVYHWWFSGKNSPANVGDTGSVVGLGRSPAEENENPLKYSCLENPMDRGT